MELRNCRNWVLCSILCITKVSSAYLLCNVGGLAAAQADWGSHGYSLDLFIILTLEEEICVFEAELKKGGDMMNGHCCSYVEFYILF